MPRTSIEERFARWLAALETRHLATLTAPEVARALRALSSCYVERRSRLEEGGALASAGKRAAFALFYAPLHFLTTRLVVRALAPEAVREVVDLGCGTGAAGAAWAMEAGDAQAIGFDRHPWAVAEANWTYRHLELSGRASRQDAARVSLRGRRGSAILAAYTVNELADPVRRELLTRLAEAHARGSAVLIVEPIARRMSPWWTEWDEAFRSGGGRADEWRFEATLPPRQRALAVAAGLKVRELTARSLCLPAS